jgi:hypothetical protein
MTKKLGVLIVLLTSVFVTGCGATISTQRGVRTLSFIPRTVVVVKNVTTTRLFVYQGQFEACHPLEPAEQCPVVMTNFQHRSLRLSVHVTGENIDGTLAGSRSRTFVISNRRHREYVWEVRRLH